MSNKEGKIDKIIKVVDKLTESKGISKLGKTLNKTLDIAGNVINSTAEITNHQLDERNKRHQSDVKVPDIIGLNLDQTKDLFDSLDLKYAFLTVNPDIKYTSVKVDTVIKTVPKAKTVLSAGEFVKIYYLSAESLEKSQKILENSINKKQSRKKSAKVFINKIGHGTTVGASEVLNVSKKLVPHAKHPKKIKADIIEVSKESDETKE